MITKSEINALIKDSIAHNNGILMVENYMNDSIEAVNVHELPDQILEKIESYNDDDKIKLVITKKGNLDIVYLS